MIPRGHHECAVASVGVMHPLVPTENYSYFYLGNWLTDVSQFIAPVDYAAAERAVVQEGEAQMRPRIAAAQREYWYLTNSLVLSLGQSRGYGEINAYINEMFGNPPPQGSAFAEFFRDLSYVAGWATFCRAYQAAQTPGEQAIPFAEYDRIFRGRPPATRGRYTQYFPHEHLDRWPMNESRPSRDGRRIYDYLERDLVYVSELLSRVERDWARATSASDEAAKHDALVEFGHAMHAIEDYFAHSNYVEHAMQSIGRTASGDHQRIFQRRLLREVTPRSQSVDDHGALVAPGPTEAETMVVTGYYDGVDTRFSLARAAAEMQADLERLRSQLPGLPAMSNPFNHRDTPPEYRDMKRREMRDAHQRLLFPPEVAAAHFRFVELDWRLETRWGRTTNPSGLLERMREEGTRYEQMTFADASRFAERIGSHTLLAKDQPNEQPFYTEAMNLAKRVGVYVTRTMLSGVASHVPVARGGQPGQNPATVTAAAARWVDWLELLRYFCGHPLEARVLASGQPPTYWWSLAHGGNLSSDTGHTVQTIAESEANTRAALQARTDLETLHNSTIPIERARSGFPGRAMHDVAGDFTVAQDRLAVHVIEGYGAAVRVECRTGELRVELVREETYESRITSVASGVVRADQAFSGQFPHLDRTTRLRVQIVGNRLGASTYRLDFVQGDLR